MPIPRLGCGRRSQDILPQDKVQVLDPIDQAQDWESFLVNGVAFAHHTAQGMEGG